MIWHLSPSVPAVPEGSDLLPFGTSSTGAGGQDDVRSNQLPHNILLSPLPGNVLCMGDAPNTNFVLKVLLLCSTPCSFFASQPHAIYLPCVVFTIRNVLYEVFDLCYVKSLFCVVWRLHIVLCAGFCMCYENCSPNGLAALRRARFACFGSLRGWPGTWSPR